MGLMDGLTAHQRYKRGIGQQAQQVDSAMPSPVDLSRYDGDVVNRGELFPIGEYRQPDGSSKFGLAWPGILSGDLPQMGDRSPEAAQAYGRAAVSSVMFPGAGRAAAGVPSNALGIFGGRLAKTADQAALAKAEEMAAKGAPREQIWTDTGWFKGPDKKWRFEIDDSGLRTSVGKNALAVEHDDLARSYPNNWIDVSPDVRRSLFTQGAMGGGGPNSVAQRPLIVMGPTQRKRDSVASHELQHFVQDVEGFARGGTYDDVAPAALSIGPLEIRTRLGQQYLNQAGEVEARAVQKRLDYTPEQRRARFPWLDYDVPENQQIIRGILP